MFSLPVCMACFSLGAKGNVNCKMPAKAPRKAGVRGGRRAEEYNCNSVAEHSEHELQYKWLKLLSQVAGLTNCTMSHIHYHPCINTCTNAGTEPMSQTLNIWFSLPVCMACFSLGTKGNVKNVKFDMKIKNRIITR